MALPLLRIGTRGSPLALAQAYEFRLRLSKAHGVAPDAFPIQIIKTTGDMILDRPLSEVGGKGLFTKEIDAAMLAGEIEAAVHSSKDLPTFTPAGIVIAGFLPREDPRDAFISAKWRRLDDLPKGARLGTSSLRRQALVKRLRPDLRVEAIRGNVGTRLSKIQSGEFDATILALAGLNRLGLADKATSLLDLESFPPAVGQGAIGLTMRARDGATAAALAPILDADTGIALAAERAFLTALDGSCKTSIAGHAVVADGRVTFRGLVLSADGAKTFAIERSGPAAHAARLGAQAGEEILARLPGGVLP